ncbi:sensor histidine kinase [Nonomuraea rhizosphaerae]|uniref:sensor histidine kinase n=1 Tax=Nonomuraea rhizosphaerae TaxID=2665663 RepID=UPI001FECABCE|nr:ATP-binding protein [Nonomuraea rhizosphaerae]
MTPRNMTPRSMIPHGVTLRGMTLRGMIPRGMTSWRGQLAPGLASVRLRATVAATLVVAVALGVAALVLVTVLRGSLVSAADEEAARKAVAAVPYAQTIDLTTAGTGTGTGGSWRTTTALPGGEAQPGLAQRSDTLAIRTSGTVRLVDSDVMVTAVGATPTTEGWPEGSFAVAGMTVATSAGPGVVWARASLAGADEALRTLNSALLPGVPALLLVVAGMTWISVGRALKPVAAIRAKVADITARDLHQRVPVPRSGDEIADLATTVNGTLDRLETAVETHKRFVADAAHELRSPIATLRARLELAEQSELTAEALADVERLQTLAADLLLLAKLDAGEPLRTDDLDLGQVAAEESLRAGRRPELRMELDVEPDVVFQGSRAHVARLVTNLVDNATRHAAEVVRVEVRQEDGEAVLRVLDDGPGIPEEQREAVFDRFTRLDEARARDAGGAGLGLPIARDIAQLHGGTLVAEDGGFIVKFPMNHDCLPIRVDG